MSTRTLAIGGRIFTFDFVVADVRQHILGADFLAEFYLAPNHRDGSLLDLQSFDTLPATIAKDASPENVNFVDKTSNQYYQLLNQYPDILNPTASKLKDPTHGVKHYIPTEGRPVQSRARKLAPDKLAIA